MGCLDEASVLALVEGALDAQERARAEHHLARCSECRTLVARTADALLSTGALSFDSDAALGTPPRTPRTGEVVGRYRVTSFLGCGAMGVVVAADDEQLGRSVALKLLRRDASREARGRFLREARAASSIRHPGVVGIHDVLMTGDGHPVIVMDRLEGETLRERLERAGTLPASEALAIARAIADALSAAHARGVVHRDLKPENVFLARREDGSSEVKLVDFGVAKLSESVLADGADLTATGTIVGTPYYMAPEQAFGRKDVDARADLWALGVILYECMSGRRPFAADSVGQVLELLALRELTPLADVAPETPEPVITLVERLLSERDQRPASAAAVREAIDAIDLSARPAPSRARYWLAGALALLALLFGVWGAWLRSEPTPASVPERSELAQAAPALVVPITTPAVLSARAEPARVRVAPSRAARPAAAPAEPQLPDAGAAKVGPGKLLTEPLF